MIVVDEKYCSKQDAVKRYNTLAKSSDIYFADGSFEAGSDFGGYGFISEGKNSVQKMGVDRANSPVEMEMQAIKHTLIYLNLNKNNIDNVVIFNDCLCAISKIKKYFESGVGQSEILREIAFLLNSLSDKNLNICWIKKEVIPTHEKVDSLSKAARMVQR